MEGGFSWRRARESRSRYTGPVTLPTGRPLTPEVLERIIRRLRSIDPDLVAAADEVDGSLLAWFATLSVEERLNRAGRMAADLQEMQDARRPD